MQTLTEQAVLDTAVNLMIRNGWTTTLAVKSALRDAGYYCEQDGVSRLMQKFALSEKWDCTSYERCNIYTLSTTEDDAINDLMNIINVAFGIHMFSMSADSRIGRDLALTEKDYESIVGLNFHVEYDEDLTLSSLASALSSQTK